MKFKTCNPYDLRIPNIKFEWNWTQKIFSYSVIFDNFLKIWKIQKEYQRVPPFGKKRLLSLISLKFYVWDFETIRISDFEFHQKKFFLIFSHFHLMLEDTQKFSTSDFSNFLVKNVKSSFTGSWQIPKGTKSWNLVNLPLAAQ